MSDTPEQEPTTLAVPEQLKDVVVEKPESPYGEAYHTTPEEMAIQTAHNLADIHGIDIPKHWEGTEQGLGADHDGVVDDTIEVVCGGITEEARQLLLDGGVIVRRAPNTATVGDEMTGKEPGSHWTPNLEQFQKSIPMHYVPNNRFTSMTHYYPFHDYSAVVGIQDIQDPEQLLGQHEINNEPDHKYHTICAGLKHFFTTVKPNALATGCAMTYPGFVGNTEVTYIRFERDHVDPITFVLRADTFDRFIEDWVAGINDPVRKQRAIEWATEPNSDPNLQAKGYRKRICQKAMEFPLDMLYPPETFVYDGLFNGDFQLIDDVIDRFKSRFNRFIGMATKHADKLAPMIKHRDHNLVLTFKGNKTLDGLVIGLDKVPPRLENGEYHLGEHPIVLEDWHQYGNSAVVVVRKINKVSQWVEQLIKECKAELPDHPYAQERFAKVMKEQLLASSHFIKELYQIDPNAVRDYVEEVANGMVCALNDHGGNIGLDLNTWKVYQYQDNGLPPVPLVVEELNFRKTVYEVHTDRFMELLYIFMYALSSPYIRPYTHKVVVDGNDGIKIGSVRHIKEAGDPLAEQPVETLKDLEEPAGTPGTIAALKEESWENMKNE